MDTLIISPSNINIIIKKKNTFSVKGLHVIFAL